MAYLDFYVKSVFEFLYMPVHVFGFSFRFIDLDIFVILSGIFIFFVRRLLDF